MFLVFNAELNLQDELAIFLTAWSKSNNKNMDINHPTIAF
jgi:hypothetical protein